LKTSFLGKLGFFTRIPEQLSLHFSDFYTIYYVIYKIQEFESMVEDSFYSLALGSFTQAPGRFQSSQGGPQRRRDAGLRRGMAGLQRVSG
jgi:hypothetical protein